jgi:site-specific DNA recombinase
MTSAAIYARYSSDLQDARSIDDQVALCRRHAERAGWTIVAVYADREISGASVHGRGDYDRMLVDARARKFAVIIAEDIDRLARKQVDTLQLRDRMEFIGVQIHTVADGRVTKLNAGFKGLMSEMFLDNLALHVRRGQAGRVSEGRAGGGLTYGYDVLPADIVAGARKPRRGGRAINEEQATVVRRIFAEYVAGRRPREIVAGLNRDRIKPPRGGREWRASALVGNAQRGAGILNNELYVGRLVWNKVRMIKDPDTGRRVSRPNPKAEWQTVAVPDLRIVDDDTFAAAGVTRTQRGSLRPQYRRGPKRLLSGLLLCGCCGAGMALKDAASSKYRRVQCSRMKEAGTCENRHAYAIEPIERRVLENLAQHLRDPRAIERFLLTYRAERKRLATSEAGRRAQAEKRLGEVKREIERSLQSMIKGLVPAEEIGPHVTQLSAEKKQLEAELAAGTADIVALHPTALTRYLAAVDDLAGMLAARALDGASESPKALRDLIACVIVHPPVHTGDPPAIEIKGRLAALTGADLFAQARFGVQDGSGGVLPLPPEAMLNLPVFALA